MMVFIPVLVLVVALSGCGASIFDNRIDEPVATASLNLPARYYMKGILFLPYAELQQPIEAWVDMNTQKSRVDYFNGVQKVYQYGAEGEYGIEREVVPTTHSREETNVPTCKTIVGSPSNIIKTQALIPEEKGFKLVGRQMYGGHVCEKWELTETKYTRVNTYTLLVRREEGKPIPVKYQMHGFNHLYDSHYDHYYVLYSEFEERDIDPSIFEIKPEIQCPNHKGDTKHTLYARNPLRELINRDDSYVNDAFEDFKSTHNKEYKNENEHEFRKDTFAQNLRFIDSKNKEGLSYSLAVNHLADRSNEEIKGMMGFKQEKSQNIKSTFTYTPEDVESLPENWDWRIPGAVTPVKDQATCGSCWAFGAVGAIEGAYFVKHGQRVVFSEQALVDCSWGEGNNGCDGGRDFRAYEFIIKAGGLPSQNDYGTYLGIDGLCHIWNATKSVSLDSYKKIKTFDEEGLKVALFKHGPVSVALDANPKTLQFYSSGVFYDPTCMNKPEEINHAVLAVGYGTLHGKPYWLIKNSWSTHWGNDGYMLLSREDDNCGVTASPTFPILK